MYQENNNFVLKFYFTNKEKKVSLVLLIFQNENERMLLK